VDKTAYCCMPLSELELDGIESAGDIANISTSCRCVRATIVGYLHSPSESRDALRIDFLPEKAAAVSVPTRLVVEITITTTSGAARTLTVNVLETQELPHS
jgi:hypothetical protein